MTLPIFLAVAAAIAMVLVLLKASREYMRLPELPVSPAPAPSDITVIIPARNEARNIAAAVKCFVDQAPVLVVDDASSDKTAMLAKQAGAYVIAAPPLKKYIAGKANACAAGAKVAESTWLLFVDADTRFTPAFLPSLMAEVRAKSLDVASVFLRQKYAWFWEALVLPYAIALSFTGVSATNLNNKKSFDSLASGSCMLFRREVYEFIGGHTAVSTSFIEDAMLAYTVKRHRINQQVMRAEHLGTLIRADGLRGVRRWLERSSFRFMLVSRWCGIWVLLSALLLTAYVPVVVYLAWLKQPLPAAIVALIPPVLLVRWYGGIHRSILAPFAIYAFNGLFILALISTALGRNARWKGRRV